MYTRAIKYFKRRKITYEDNEYEKKEKGAGLAAKATGFPLERIIKTLVVDIGNKKYALALMPGDKKLDLKHFAKTAGVKRAAMADTETAERITGYLVGGISPFGTKRMIPAVMDQSIADFDKVLINAGHRGTMLLISPENILKNLNCRTGKIARR